MNIFLNKLKKKKHDLEQAIAACEEDESIRVVVLKGSEKAFVAGADIEHMSKGNVNVALI